MARGENNEVKTTKMETFFAQFHTTSITFPELKQLSKTDTHELLLC